MTVFRKKLKSKFDPGGTWTHNPQLRRLMPYPLGHRADACCERFVWIMGCRNSRLRPQGGGCTTKPWLCLSVAKASHNQDSPILRWRSRLSNQSARKTTQWELHLAKIHRITDLIWQRNRTCVYCIKWWSVYLLMFTLPDSIWFLHPSLVVVYIC